MTDPIRWASAVTLLVVTIVTVGYAQSGEVTIASADQGPILLLPADASDRIRSAAEDLQRVLAKMTGVRPELADEPMSVRSPVIAVGLGKLARRHVTGEEIARLGPEGLIIKTFDGGVILAGRTDLGTEHAVYAFLTRLGCRWFFAGEAWEEIPSRKDIALDPLYVHEEPDFQLRSMWYGWGPQITPKCKADYAAWMRRNNMGGTLTGDVGHNYDRFADPDKDFAKHPEWFPLIDGKRTPDAQLCLSNPDVLQRAIEYVRGYFRANPSIMMASLSPNDGGGYCQCDNCAAMGSISDQTLTYANGVAEAIADEFPDKYLGMYAYYLNCDPPSVQGHPQIVIFIATSFLQGDYTVTELVDGWSGKVKQIGIRDFLDTILWSSDMPQWKVDDLRRMIPYYHSRNVVAINAEASNNWAPQGLNYYIAAKLMWNAGVDVDSALQDFHEDCWHRAAPAMRRYYERWKGGARMTGRTLGLCYGDLDEAAKLVADDPVVLRRVDLFRLYLHWVRLYRRNNQASGEEDMIRTAREALHFAWRIVDMNMIHSYGHFEKWNELYRLPGGFAFGEDEVFQWKYSDAPPGQRPARREPRPFFTHAEVERMFRKDMASLPHLIDVTDRNFATDLIPITSAGVRLPDGQGEHRPIYRCANHFVLYAAKPGKIRVGIETGLIRRSTTEYTLTFMGDKEPVAKGELAAKKHVLEMSAPKKGAYVLAINPRNKGGFRMDFGKAPACVMSGRERGAQIVAGTRAFYFFVPKGTTSFAFGFQTPDKHGTVIIRNPKGETVLKKSGNFATGGEFAVRVPKGAAGKVWSLAIEDCEDSQGMYLLGVPPYLSQRADLLLVPRKRN